MLRYRQSLCEAANSSQSVAQQFILVADLLYDEHVPSRFRACGSIQDLVHMQVSFMTMTCLDFYLTHILAM